MTESVRLAKHLATMLGCSRREAELYIEGGGVTVQGQVIEEPGFRVQPGDAVALLPGAYPEELKPVTIMLHKPAGYGEDDAARPARQLIGADTLAPDDRSGLRFLKKYLGGLELATPLETQASGLMVFTQEYSILRKLRDDARNIEQEYIVEVKGDPAPDALELLNNGLSWQGRALAPRKASWQSENRLRFALKTPPPGLIPHLCEQVGLTVVAIRRISIGRLSMAGLPAGQWRYRLGYERF